MTYIRIYREWRGWVEAPNVYRHMYGEGETRFTPKRSKELNFWKRTRFHFFRQRRVHHATCHAPQYFHLQTPQSWPAHAATIQYSREAEAALFSPEKKDTRIEWKNTPPSPALTLVPSYGRKLIRCSPSTTTPPSPQSSSSTNFQMASGSTNA
jgi:hypothetical protein